MALEQSKMLREPNHQQILGSPEGYSYYVKKLYSQETAQPATASAAFSLVRGHCLNSRYSAGLLKYNKAGVLSY